MKSALHNVGGWIARQAARDPGRPCVVDDERRLDYAGLEARTARAAGWLRRLGVGPGDRVALLLRNRSAYLEILFAAARIGAIFLPINTRLSPREIRFLLDDATPAVCCHESELEAVVAAACDGARSPRPACLSIARYEDALASAEAHSGVEPVSPDDPMMLMYTSGTTGEPKGALLPHRKALYNSLNAQLYFGIRSDDRVLVATPLFHSLGLQILSLPVLYTGGSLFLHGRFDPEAVWRAVGRERITFLGGVPTMYQRLVDDPGARSGDTGSLRFLFTAGSAVDPELVRKYSALGLVLRQGYGQTETSILCCLDAENALRKAGSVGKPVFHADVRIVALDRIERDPAVWRDVAVGETGEIVARGPIAMLGYWRRPEASAETLRAGWVRTGDLASVDSEGFFTLVGRAREMFISGGENVYPAEVEAAYQEHPAIREIAVVGVPDARWGEVGRGYLVLENESTLDPEELAKWGRDRLASFKLPKSFVAVNALPRTATGKVQKHLLPSAGDE